MQSEAVHIHQGFIYFLKELYVKFSSFEFVLEKYSIHQTNADLQQYLKQEVTSLRPLCVQTSWDADSSVAC